MPQTIVVRGLLGPLYLTRGLAAGTNPAASSLLGACHTLYAATSGLTNLIPATSFYTNLVPPNVPLPWGVLTRVANRPAYASNNTRMESTLVQFSFYSDSVDTIDQVADAMKAAFIPTASMPLAGGVVTGVYLTDDRIVTEAPRGPGKPWVFGLHLSYLFLVSRTT